ncbi:prostate androgen-regulated mucin-like protein 1 isoform X2 [Manis pentadactyla]|uniref:prostate androgen-regulated mucin-like protein 1 isoform X2 n=1 Tax=Manis pentadactyla TaxID=143292 RepID=UPI00255CB971|nr:prostate androgen-regulated mucin-like protein 1 isoform X2 [Manis pentadactyla]KAI5278905.1 Prostate Androgen-Regulated Mucin-Like Protein 1 [Manis pentadactyla]
MVCKTLFALCIFTAGLRVQSVPTSTLLPVSLPATITPLTTSWTSSLQGNPASTTSDTLSKPTPLVTASAQLSPLPRNDSVEPRDQETTSPTLHWKGANTDPSPTSSEVPLTPTPAEHSSGTQEASVPATGSQPHTATESQLTATTGSQSPVTTGSQSPGTAGSQSPVATGSQPPVATGSQPPATTGSQFPTASGSQSSTEPPTLTSPQPPAPSPPPLSTALPEVFSASVSTNHSSTETSTRPTRVPTTPELPTETPHSGHTLISHATTKPGPSETTSQATGPAKVTCMLIDPETTTSPGMIMQGVEHALSSGSIAAITVTVIAVVLLVFGAAAYLKIRHSSYGRLLDDHDYGSWGNYNNPLYDDS